jgi:replicative DNA helicase
MINSNDIKEEIKARLPKYLQSHITTDDEGILCNGTSEKGFYITGKDGQKHHMHIDPNNKEHVKCFSTGSDNSYHDIFDLIGFEYNLTTYPEKEQKAKELFTIGGCTQMDMEKIADVLISSEAKKREIKPEPKETDYTSYFNEMSKSLLLTDYAKKRGLSIEVLNKFNIGYDTNKNSLIIPTSDYSYTARNILNCNNTDRYRKTGKAHIFNSEAIKTATKPIVIVEGEIDALSIIEAGGEAVGLGSTANVNIFFSSLKANKPKQPLIIALDEDPTGQEATQKLKEGLTSLHIPCIDNLTFKPCKDANGLLCKDRELLKSRILTAEEGIINMIENIKDEALETYKKKSTGSILNTFLQDIEKNKVTPIPTGYNQLDQVLNGGLVGGLYGIGAISSLGKTTFILQMADQIAQTGKDVLIFSLEMKKETLISKSLSRIMYQRAGSPEITKNYEPYLPRGNKQGRHSEEVNTPLSSQEIVQGCKYGMNDGDINRTEVTPEEKKALGRAITDYKKYGEHLYIFEPKDVEKDIYGLKITQIEGAIDKHFSITGNIPVVIVDYLQLIQPLNDKGNDKSNTDFTIHGLKAIADKFNTPVMAISSFNRNSYNAPVNLASFKESGGIEYSCDVLMGLQYDLKFKLGSNKETASPEDLLNAKKKPISEVKAVILKNRNGLTGTTINYKFTGKYNTFTEVKKKPRGDI